VAESTGGRQLLLMLEDFSKHELDKLEYHDPEYIMDSFLSLICVMVAGLAAGLTMGMLSADELELEIFLNGGGRCLPLKNTPLSPLLTCGTAEEKHGTDAVLAGRRSPPSRVCAKLEITRLGHLAPKLAPLLPRVPPWRCVVWC
jgi:hypothetical protein